MPDPDAKAEQDSAGERPEPGVADAVEATESYRTEEGVVFYDAENPLGWMQAGEVVDLDEVALLFTPESLVADVPPIGDDDSAEPDEFDPGSLGPEAPGVDTDSGDSVEIDGDVDEVLLRTFWGAVLSLNVAMAAVPLGLLLIYFRGDWELGGLAVAVG